MLPRYCVRMGFYGYVTRGKRATTSCYTQSMSEFFFLYTPSFVTGRTNKFFFLDIFAVKTGSKDKGDLGKCGSSCDAVVRLALHCKHNLHMCPHEYWAPPLCSGQGMFCFYFQIQWTERQSDNIIPERAWFQHSHRSEILYSCSSQSGALPTNTTAKMFCHIISCSLQISDPSFPWVRAWGRNHFDLGRTHLSHCVTEYWDWDRFKAVTTESGISETW